MTFGSGPLFLGPDVAGWQTIAELAQPTPPSQPNDGGGHGEDVGKSSPVGFLVLLLFFVAVGFLVRSMNKHLKRVPASFDRPEDAPGDEPAGDAEVTEVTEAEKDKPAETNESADKK